MKATNKNGIFSAHPQGYGFITPDRGGDDLFVPPNATGGAIHGDTVAYKLEIRKGEKKPVALITQVIKRGKPTLVGTFHNGQVIPMDKRIPHRFTPTLKSRARFPLADGHRLIFSVKKKDPGMCTIAEVIGHINDPGVDVLSLVHDYNVPYIFPPAALEEAAQVNSEIKIENRLDLREASIFTLDGEDTKDIDDAISLVMQPDDSFLLGVHIADVAHYVPEGSACDREAAKRGNSVYLADRVIPMLPHALSNGICSLNPGEDRLTISCLMTVDMQGHVTSYEIKPSVIRSKYRFTYERVQQLLDGDAPTELEAGWMTTLTNINRLREILQNKRTTRGAMQFNMPETKMRVDEKGWPISIDAYAHNEATGLIEECMILCNETIAAHFYQLRVPFLYRVHEPPDAEKLRRLITFLKEYRLKLRGNKLKDLLEYIADKPYAYAITQAVLRAQQQARYTPTHDRHFGLASECYTHFTSPIRRYADLQIHRIIKASLAEEEVKRFKAILPDIGNHCSGTERTAENLERAVNQMKKAQFMQGKEGQHFEGTVVGIEKWGVYVMLPNTIEGLIPVESLRRIPKKSRPQFLLGDPVHVRVQKVDAEESKIYFSFIPPVS